MVRREVIGLTAGVLLALGLITASRVPVWTDDRALWAAAVSVTPEKPRALVNLGRALVLTGEPDAGIAFYQAAMRAAADSRRPAFVRVETRLIVAENLIFAGRARR